MVDLLDRPITVEKPPMGDEPQQTVLVSVPLTDVLNGFRQDMKDGFGRVERGVDSANSALALKADKADVAHLTERVDGHDIALAALKGWRAGFLVAIGLSGGLVGALILHAVGVV